MLQSLFLSRSQPAAIQGRKKELIDDAPACVNDPAMPAAVDLTS